MCQMYKADAREHGASVLLNTLQIYDCLAPPRAPPPCKKNSAMRPDSPSPTQYLARD